MAYNSAPVTINKAVALTVTSANSTIVLPPGAYITGITVKNNTANAITGGLKFGKTNGATDIVVALTVGVSAFAFVLDAALLLRTFSTTATQQIFIDAVVSWNSASVDITVFYVL